MNDWGKWKWEKNGEAAAALKRTKEANSSNPNLQLIPRWTSTATSSTTRHIIATPRYHLGVLPRRVSSIKLLFFKIPKMRFAFLV